MNGRKRLNKIIGLVLSYPKRIGSKVSLTAAVFDSEVDRSAALDSFVRFYNSSVGKYSYIGLGSFVYRAKIGSFCSIGGNCTIGAPSHQLTHVSTSPVFTDGSNILGVNFSRHPIAETPQTSIANDVWIGMGSFIKSGVSIATGSVIGMGSVVTKDVGPYEIWAGNPARLVRKRFEGETIDKLLRSEWWELDAEELKQIAPLFDSPDKFLNG